MRSIASLVLILLFALIQSTPVPPTSPLKRRVQGQALISDDLPAARFIFSKDYRYVGGQVVNLYGNADAEQHLFVKGASSGPVEGFYWIQFEHFLPSNNRTYDYVADRTADFGPLRFIYDVKSFPDYDTMQAEDPQSDGAAIRRLLARHNLSFPKKAARVRLFYLPTPDHRTELMIIYGEALAADSKVPVAEHGIALDSESPEAAKTLLENAQKGVSVRKQ